MLDHHPGYTNMMRTMAVWPDNDVPPRPFTEELVDGWMKSCAERGVTAVVWQPNVETPRPETPAPHTVKSNFLSAT
jgi:hypothetical protein